MTISRDVWHPIEILPEEYIKERKHVWVAQYIEPSDEARSHGAVSFWSKGNGSFMWWSEHFSYPAFTNVLGGYPSHFMITDDDELAQTTNPDIIY